MSLKIDTPLDRDESGHPRRSLIAPGTVQSRVQRALYATMFVCFLFGMMIVAALQGGSFSTEVAKEFGWQMFAGTAPLVGLVVLFGIVERWRPAGPHKPMTGWALNITVMLIGTLLGPLSGALLGASLAKLGSTMGLGLIDLRPTTGSALANTTLAFVIWVAVFDFFYYWFHRFQHENPFLWQQHKLHHLDEQLSASTVTRDHPLEALFQAVAVSIPMTLLFKLTPAQGGLLGTLFIGWLVFIHSNLRIGFGRAAPLVTSPQLHRVHHSCLLEHRDKNFSAFVPIWDVLFGTYFFPRRDEYPPTGVHDEQDVRSVAAAILLPFREWWHMLRGTKA